MKKYLSMSVLALSAFSTLSYGYTLDCSSANSKIQYQLRRTNGGAPIGPTELLRVNGKDIINVSPFANAELRGGRIELTKKTVVPTGVAKDPQDFKTTYFNALAKVTDNNNVVLAKDMVHCKEVTYHGVPIP